jgi:NAD(P)-dependent dehydrogenase (short-subunit alcohol dehydrogenase family)
MHVRTWFITGAGSGFGRCLTRLLLDRGEHVVATSRRTAALLPLLDGHGGSLRVETLDVTDTAGMRKVVGDAFARGRIDVVVNCAGAGVLGAAEELSDDLLTRQLDVNLVGAIQLARAVIPHLREQGGGRIIQLSSMGSQAADPAMSVYDATKAGIEGFYESVALEVADFGIGITLVQPGGSRTDFNSNITSAEPLPVYDKGIVGQIRGFLAGADPETVRRAVIGDPDKIARAIADSVETTPAPRRLVLGATAYEAVTAALRDRLAAIEAQRELAYSTDADDAIAARAGS